MAVFKKAKFDAAKFCFFVVLPDKGSASASLA